MSNQNTIEIILKAVDQGLRTTLSGVSTAFNRINSSSQEYHKTLSSLNGTADHFKNTIMGVAAAIGGANLFKSAGQQAIAFNSTVENSRIGIAALIRTFTTADMSGSFAGAEDIQKRLQIAGLETTATYQELLLALQQGIGPALREGFNSEQIVKFTKDMTLAAAAISLPMDQLGQELRAILDGTIDRNARIANALQINNKDVEKWKEAGTLFQEVENRLKAVSMAGDQAAATFSGRLSNLHDAIQMFLGKGLESSFTGTTELFKKLQDAIVTIDAKAGTFTFNEKLTAALKEVDDAISETLSKFSQDELSGMMASLVEVMGSLAVVLISFGTGLAKLWQSLGPMAPALVSIIATMTLWGGAFKAVIGLPMFLGAQLIALHAAFVTMTGVSLTAWGFSLVSSLMAINSAAMTMTTALGMAAGATIALVAGYKIGEWIQMRNVTQGLADATKDLANGQRRLAGQYKEITTSTGVAVHSMEELDQAVADGKLHYSELTGKWMAGATDMEAVAIRQAGLDEKKWKAFEKQLKVQEKLIGLANDEGQVTAANAALSYAQQGLDADQADIKVRQIKIGLIDAEINKLEELRKSIPAITPNDEGAAASAGLEGKINGLRVTRLGLLKADVDAEHKAAEERRKNNEKELQDAQALAATRARYAAQNKLLALEEEKVDAARLPTAMARAQAIMAIDARISAQRIALKKEEIAAFTAKGNDAEVMRAENELVTLKIDTRQKVAQSEKEVASIQLHDSEDLWRRMGGNVEDYQAAVAEALDKTVIDAEEANRRMILSSDNMTEALKLGFSDWAATVQTDAEFVAGMFGQVANSIGSGLAAAFDSMADGSKSAKDAMLDLARSTISMVAQMIAQHLIYNAIKSAGSAFGLSTGGPVPAFAGGGMVGGWSPSSKADNIPAWLTAREFVQPVASVDYYGAPFMEAIRRRLFPRSLARALSGMTLPRIPSGNRLAEGGMAAGSSASTTFKGGDTRLKVVNVIDKHMVGDFMRTADGETALINMIRRNGSTIRTIIGA